MRTRRVLAALMVASCAFVLAAPQCAVGSVGRSVGARLRAAATSRSAIAMETQLAGALTDPSVASLSKSLISQDAGLTPFQKDMLGVNVLLARPNVRAALAVAKHGHRLTRVQIHVLLGVFASFAHNPAVELLIAEGRRLKGQPATLAADVAAGSNPPARLSSGSPETPDALYNADWSRFARAWEAAHAQQLSGETRTLLTAPGATSYLRTLPPLAVASLIPEEQFLALHLPSKGAKATRNDRRATAHSAAEEGYAAGLATLEAKLGLDQVLGSLQDELVLKAILKGATVIFSGAVADASAPWLLAIADFLGAIGTGEAIVGALPKLAYLNEVAGLEIVPSSPTVSAGQPVQYKIIAEDKSGHPIDYVPAPSVHLAFVDNPDAPVDPYETCNDATQTCSAGRKGAHSIEADFDFVHGFASLMITPGAETGLELSPDPNTTEAGVLSPEFTATGLDSYGNDLGAVTDFTLTASSGASCTGHTCISGSAGTYAVTATDGKGLGAATLTVTGGLMITPASLPDAVEGTPYSQTLRLTGGEEAFSWSVESGSLPTGLELDSVTGELTGTPLEHGVSTFSVTAYTYSSVSVTRTYTLAVNRSGVIAFGGGESEPGEFYECVECTFGPVDTTLAGSIEEIGIYAIGGTPPYTWTIAGSTEPYDGLTLAPVTEADGGFYQWGAEYLLAGSLPEQIGDFTIPITVRDDYGDVGTMYVVFDKREP